MSKIDELLKEEPVVSTTTTKTTTDVKPEAPSVKVPIPEKLKQLLETPYPWMTEAKLPFVGLPQLPVKAIAEKIGIPTTPAESLGKPLDPFAAAIMFSGGIKTPKTSVVPIPEEPIDPVNKVINALRVAKPLRKQQEALYSAARAERVAEVAKIGKQIPGEAGYIAQLSALKGELPKVQYESIKGSLSQADVNNLFQRIESSAIPTLDKITAKNGLAKILGAKGAAVPNTSELTLLSEVFPEEFIKTALDMRPVMEKLWGGVHKAFNLPRAMMATLDLSAPLRQGAFLVGRPKQWVPAFKEMFRSAAKEKNYLELTQNIRSRPSYKLMRESRLSLTDIGDILGKREEAFISNWAEKIPGFGKLARASNRAYVGFLNKLRADVFDDLLNAAKKEGVLAERPEVVKDIARFVNSATGRGEMGKLEPAALALSDVFFSPRLIFSRLNLLNPSYYIKLDPLVRKEALKSLLSFGGVASTVLGLAKLGGAEVGVDPRSSDFAKIKVGNTRYDVLAGFQQYMVLFSRLITGKMVSSTTGKEFTIGEGYKPTTKMDILQRFVEGKAAPVTSFALGALRGKGFAGKEFDVPVELANRFIPMVVSDMYELYKEKGFPGIGMVAPGVFGVGVQTYGDLIPLESRTAKGKPTIKWRDDPGLAEDVINLVRRKEVKPIYAKEVYDQVQSLLKEDREFDARILVNSLSKKDYILYKKIKQKELKIKEDLIKQKVTPTYKQIRRLVEQGNEEAAKKILNDMTEEEYRQYKKIKEEDIKDRRILY